MAGRLRGIAGGILSLCELHDEFPEAFEHEFIVLGLRWRDVGTTRLSWRDAVVIIREAPGDGAFARSKYPDQYLRDFRLGELILYQLQFLSVLHGNQSRARKGDFPQPPEWTKDELTNEWAPDKPGRWGTGALPIDELDKFLGINGYREKESVVGSLIKDV